MYTRPTRGPQYYELPSESGKVASLDLYGPLPRSHDGNNYVLVIMDQFTKYTKIYPIKNQKLKTLEHVIENWYIPDIGRTPEEILTDCGGQFITNKWRKFAQKMGFKIKRTSPYNPQSNPVERVIRGIGRALLVYACDNHRRWDEVLLRVEQVINATKHSSTDATPAELEGRTADLTIGPPETLKPIETVRRDRNELNRLAREHLAKMTDKRRREAEKHDTANRYTQGDLVWLKSHRRSDMRRAKTRKLFPLYEGPFRVDSQIYPNAYKITRLTGEILGTYNTRQLKPHRVPTWKIQESPQLNPITESQPSQPSRIMEIQTSNEIKSKYIPDEDMTVTGSPQPGPSRPKRKRPARLSALAKKLSGSSSETEEFWIQPARTHKIEYQTESPQIRMTRGNSLESLKKLRIIWNGGSARKHGQRVRYVKQLISLIIKDNWQRQPIKPL